ncbi:tyrosine-protein phosphatase [Sporolactobacillus sp. THM7-4]|nr:tyrosine-protein phosphatase [Sporolactobacillus sp. THM7-4]
MPLRRIPLSCTLNTRDLGGYPTNDGRVTQFKRVFRSDAPPSLSAEDIVLLKRLGVTAAIDLRSQKEIETHPSAFESATDFEYFHCPFAIGNRDPGSKEGVPPLYAEIIADFPVMRKIMRIIAKQEGAVLIHCASGKDRTGVVTAILLLSAGACMSDILADYQISYTYIRAQVREILRQHPELPDYIGRTDMEYMETTLEQFFKTYGDVNRYLEKIGLGPDEISSIKNKLCL